MNLGDLKTHLADTLNRTDMTDALKTRFIDQAIQRIQRQLRIPVMEKQQIITVSSAITEVTLPSDFLEIIDVYHANRVLSRVPMSRMQDLKKVGEVGNAEYFAREQSDLLLYPGPTDGTVTINYYGEFDAMTSDSAENDLARIAPDLIIYGALTYASDYFIDERGPLFEQKFIQFMTEIQEQAFDQELNGGTMSVQPAYTY